MRCVQGEARWVAGGGEDGAKECKVECIVGEEGAKEVKKTAEEVQWGTGR
jgi:hypothetical protein